MYIGYILSQTINSFYEFVLYYEFVFILTIEYNKGIVNITRLNEEKVREVFNFNNGRRKNYVKEKSNHSQLMDIRRPVQI